MLQLILRQQTQTQTAHAQWLWYGLSTGRRWALSLRSSARLRCILSRNGQRKFIIWYVIDFYGDARQYVKDRIWADDQKITDFDKEDRTRIEFTSTQFLSIQEWVLAKGGNAIPREPQWLVEEWQDQIKQMVKNTKLKFLVSATDG